MAHDEPYVTVRLPRDLVARIDRLAAARDWSRRHWVLRALERVAAGEEQRPSGGP